MIETCYTYHREGGHFGTVRARGTLCVLLACLQGGDATARCSCWACSSRRWRGRGGAGRSHSGRAAFLLPPWRGVAWRSGWSPPRQCTPRHAKTTLARSGKRGIVFLGHLMSSAWLAHTRGYLLTLTHACTRRGCRVFLYFPPSSSSSSTCRLLLFLRQFVGSVQCVLWELCSHTHTTTRRRGDDPVGRYRTDRHARQLRKPPSNAVNGHPAGVRQSRAEPDRAVGGTDQLSRSRRRGWGDRRILIT